MIVKLEAYYYLLLDFLMICIYSYFSTLTFTHALLPLLEKTSKEEGSDVRIVNVCSSPSLYT